MSTNVGIHRQTFPLLTATFTSRKYVPDLRFLLACFYFTAFSFRKQKTGYILLRNSSKYLELYTRKSKCCGYLKRINVCKYAYACSKASDSNSFTLVLLIKTSLSSSTAKQTFWLIISLRNETAFPKAPTFSKLFCRDQAVVSDQMFSGQTFFKQFYYIRRTFNK